MSFETIKYSVEKPPTSGELFDELRAAQYSTNLQGSLVLLHVAMDGIEAPFIFRQTDPGHMHYSEGDVYTGKATLAHKDAPAQTGDMQILISPDPAEQAKVSFTPQAEGR